MNTIGTILIEDVLFRGNEAETSGIYLTMYLTSYLTFYLTI